MMKVTTKVNSKISSANTITSKPTTETISAAIAEASNSEAVVKTVAAEAAIITPREASDKITTNSKPKSPSTIKDKQFQLRNQCRCQFQCQCLNQ